MSNVKNHHNHVLLSRRKLMTHYFLTRKGKKTQKITISSVFVDIQPSFPMKYEANFSALKEFVASPNTIQKGSRSKFEILFFELENGFIYSTRLFCLQFLSISPLGNFLLQFAISAEKRGTAIVQFCTRKEGHNSFFLQWEKKEIIKSFPSVDKIRLSWEKKKAIIFQALIMTFIIKVK